MPVIRMQQGKYLIGTESKQLVITNNHVMVRIGGGFDPIAKYIEKNEEGELSKLRRLTEDGEKDIEEVIRELLMKFNAEAVVMKNFMKVLNKDVVDRALRGELDE